MRAEYLYLINQFSLRIPRKGSDQNSRNQLGADRSVPGMPFLKATGVAYSLL